MHINITDLYDYVNAAFTCKYWNTIFLCILSLICNSYLLCKHSNYLLLENFCKHCNTMFSCVLMFFGNNKYHAFKGFIRKKKLLVSVLESFKLTINSSELVRSDQKDTVY